MSYKKSPNLSEDSAELLIVKRCAFTLIEVLIALFILSIALLAILKGSVFNLRSTTESSNLTTAVIAAESILKEEIAKGYPPSGKDEGMFEGEPFKGFRWEKSVEVLELPYVEELKLVTVKISWGKNGSYTLQTVLSRY